MGFFFWGGGCQNKLLSIRSLFNAFHFLWYASKFLFWSKMLVKVFHITKQGTETLKGLKIIDFIKNEVLKIG